MAPLGEAFLLLALRLEHAGRKGHSRVAANGVNTEPLSEEEVCVVVGACLLQVPPGWAPPHLDLAGRDCWVRSLKKVPDHALAEPWNDRLLVNAVDVGSNRLQVEDAGSE